MKLPEYNKLERAQCNGNILMSFGEVFTAIKKN